MYLVACPGYRQLGLAVACGEMRPRFNGLRCGSEWSRPNKPTDEEGGDEEAPAEDVAVAPPSGPLSLYRAQLEGAFTTAPIKIVNDVDGAAVWIPAMR